MAGERRYAMLAQGNQVFRDRGEAQLIIFTAADFILEVDQAAAQGGDASANINPVQCLDG